MANFWKHFGLLFISASGHTGFEPDLGVLLPQGNVESLFGHNLDKISRLKRRILKEAFSRPSIQNFNRISCFIYCSQPLILIHRDISMNVRIWQD